MMAKSAAAKQRPQPAEDKAKPDLVLRGSRRNPATNNWETTVLLFATPKPNQLTGFVLAQGEKRHVVCHINERHPNTETGEVKPNFLVLSELVSGDGEEDRWEELGHGNAMNRRSDGKPVYYDEVLFNVGDEILSARITQKVHPSLHYHLGFEKPRVERPERARQSDNSRSADDSREAHSPPRSARR
jgi:hypothetical protein